MRKQPVPWFEKLVTLDWKSALLNNRETIEPLGVVLEGTPVEGRGLGPRFPDRGDELIDDAPLLEVDVLDAGPEHLASAGSGVGAEHEHRVHPREELSLLSDQAAVRLNERKEFLDLRHGEEQRIPEFILLVLRQFPTLNTPLDLLRA